MSSPGKRSSGTHLWKVIDAAVKDLVDNRDLGEGTPRAYIVGCLVKSMVDAGWPEDLDNASDDVCKLGDVDGGGENDEKGE